jgi:TolA-binding protein
LKKILILLLPVFLFSGCGIWSDFTTYFNIYYDTADSFNQAEQLIKQQKVDLFSNEDVPLPGAAGQLLSKVIEKASKILQFHSQTSYVENALSLLGKSFYYQKEYLKAMRKFQELITSRPNSSFVLESRLWIGKSQLKLRQFDAALKTLDDVRDEAVSKKESDIYEEAYLEEIKYRVITEDYDLAISLITEFLKVSTNDDLNAKVSYELGKMYSKQNSPQDAIAAFQNVFNYSPTYDVTLDTRIELAKALRTNGDPQKALDMMQSLRKEAKYSDAYNRIDLEIALCLIDLKRMDEGIQTLVKIDTSFSSTPSAGSARFELGKIFETKIPIYDSAFTYYMKASMSVGSDPKMLVVANVKATLFKKYQYVRSLIDDSKKLLNYAVNPGDFIKDSVAFYSDTLKPRLDESQDLTKNQNLNDRNSGREDVRLNQTSTSGITNISKKKPPFRSPLPIDTLKTNVVKNEFDLGNIFFNELNRPDSAAYYYYDILNNYPGSKHEGRTLYSLGIYYETLNDSVKADSIFSTIYDHYRTEKVVNAVAVKLKKPLVDFEFDPAKDLYADAETDMIKKNFNISLDKFYGISVKYPKSPIAPKALFASGWILENDLKLYDSAAVIYDTLTTRYPKTVYAAKVMPKLYYYKEEIQRRKSVLKDSLAKIEQAKLKGKDVDSLNNQKGTMVDSLKKLNKTMGMDSLKYVKGVMSDSLRKNIKPIGLDYLKNTKGVVSDSLKKNNKPIGLDSLNNSKGVISDSLKKFNNKLGPDSLNNNGRVMTDSLSKDIKNTPISK